jgi:spore cortex protein
LNIKILLGTLSVTALLLSACGANNNSMDEAALRNQGATNNNPYANVNYNPNNPDGNLVYGNNIYPVAFDNDNRANQNTNRNNQANVANNNNNNNNLNNTRNTNNRNNIINAGDRDTNRNNNQSINNRRNDNPNNPLNVTDQNNLNQNDRNDVGSDRNTNNNINADSNRMSLADKAAEQIAKMGEVDRANVIVTENNAYVAAKLSNDQKQGLTQEIERKIADQVKATDQDIKHVYVSVNPDFYDRMNSYANDLRNNRPISGLFDEFNTMIRRMFPSER